MPNNLDLLLNILTSIASPIKGKLERNETVIKILKQFNLAPEHPPEDFSGVYVYTLVEYGVGKPKCLLELFRQEDIKQAFRKAFDHHNPSILLGEVEAFLDAYALADEIKALQLDVTREVAAFATIFIEVTKRSRTKAEVLTSHQIISLHESIVLIQEQLERLPTLEGIRTEMARLSAGEEDKGNFLPLSSTLIALAQQMRGWFETLGYRFEKYEAWTEEYFEWIINIPIRRNRYDRVFVRGIIGEVGLKDVQGIESKVQEQKTDEGWLVSDRRISKVARDEVEKVENQHLDCFTFDELVASDADFSGYLLWLETEVKGRGIDKNYVPLACTKKELDPVSKRTIGISRYQEEDGWIEGYIDRWLDDPAKEHISILGEFGTGKTWFALHYAWVALQRYRDAQKKSVQLPRIPLVIPLRDYSKGVSAELFLSEFIFRQHKIPIPHYDAFIQLNRMGKLLLIFDGFDEMAAKVDRQQMINNFWELAKVVVPGAKVILTCRTEHFPEAREGRALLNAELQGSIANLTGETPQFEVLELGKFDDNQIRQVLSLQTEPATVELVMGNPQLLDLARRPVLTELILEALPDIAAGKPIDMSRVYLYVVRQKMERDIKAERTFTSLADKMYFLCELAWEMLSTDQMSLNYRLFPNRIRRLFGSVVQEEKDLDHWNYDMMGQTMLIRNADGDYTPAHRSLLEFFVAYKFAAELGVLADDFTELVQAQSCSEENTTPVDYTWSGYFERQLDETGRSIAIPPLKKFISEPLEKLKGTFGQSPLSLAVMDLMLGMVDDNEVLVKVIERTREKSEAEVRYVAGNAATVLVNLNKAGLEHRNVSGVVARDADFSYVSSRDIKFTGADLGVINWLFNRISGVLAPVSDTERELQDLLKKFVDSEINTEIDYLKLTFEIYRLDVNLAEALRRWTTNIFKKAQAVEVLYNLGLAYKKRKKFQKAYTIFNSAIETVESLLGENTFGSESERKQTEQWNNLYRHMIEVCLELEEDTQAIEYIERYKNRNLAQLLAIKDLSLRRNITNEQKSELRNLKEDIKKEKNLLDSKNDKLDNEPDNYTYINKLRQLYKKLLISEPIKFGDTRKLLDDESVVIQFYIFEDCFKAFIITKNDEPITWSSDADDLKKLEHWTLNEYLQVYDEDKKRWKYYLTNQLTKLASILHIDEIVSLVPVHCKKAILVPHLYLNILPLHALPLSSDKYLIDKFPGGISHAFSYQLLDNARQKLQRLKQAQQSRRLFAIQNPTGDLKFTDIEVETIASFFQSHPIVKQNAATKAALSQNPNAQYLANAYLLHFSCHAYFNAKSPSDSALILAKGKVSNIPSDTKSSRFLQISRHTVIDLKECLSLQDIFQLNLVNCRLVVLSACETGLIDIRNNSEYIGLSTGFIYAGSSGVISSLWAVSDFSTTLLMIKFYENIKNKKLYVAVALKEAQVWLREATNKDLEQWVDKLPNPNHRIQLKLIFFQESPDSRPFESPYHWAAFRTIGV